MATFTEDLHAGGFLVSESNGTRSRETVTLLSGQNCKAGHVLGKVTASGKYKEWNPANSDGSQTVAAVLHAAVDASDADQIAVIIARDAEVVKADLRWFSGATTNNQATGVTGLAALGIIGR
jgi:hypothetical protein